MVNKILLLLLLNDKNIIFIILINRYTTAADSSTYSDATASAKRVTLLYKQFCQSVRLFVCWSVCMSHLC